MKKYVAPFAVYVYDEAGRRSGACIAPGTPGEDVATILSARSAASARTSLKRKPEKA